MATSRDKVIQNNIFDKNYVCFPDIFERVKGLYPRRAG